MLLLSRQKNTHEGIAAPVVSRFEVLIERNVAKFLGMITEQDPRRMYIKVHSRSLIEQILEIFECSNCYPTVIFLPPATVLSKSMPPFDESEKEKINSVPYRQRVGSILPLSNTTRPVLAFTAGYLSTFMSNPEMGQWKAA